MALVLRCRRPPRLACKGVLRAAAVNGVQNEIVQVNPEMHWQYTWADAS